MTMTLYAWIVSLLFSGNLWDAGKHGKTQNSLFVKPYTPRLRSEITGIVPHRLPLSQVYILSLILDSKTYSRRPDSPA